LGRHPEEGQTDEWAKRPVTGKTIGLPVGYRPTYWSHIPAGNGLGIYTSGYPLDLCLNCMRTHNSDSCKARMSYIRTTSTVLSVYMLRTSSVQLVLSVYMLRTSSVQTDLNHSRT